MEKEQQNDWQEYLGKYEKKEYDIKLFNGTIYCGCWPNAGNFHTRGTDGHYAIDGAKVEAFRISHNPLITKL